MNHYTIARITVDDGSRIVFASETNKRRAIKKAKAWTRPGYACEVTAELKGVLPHVIFQS